MTIGVIVSLKESMADEFRRIRDFGLHHIQLNCWQTERYSAERAALIKRQLEEYGVAITTFWAGWSGDRHWNFTQGPESLGLVPEATRAQRVKDLIAGSDFARALGVDQIATHMGFIPETGFFDPQYEGIVSAIREVALHCRDNGQRLLFETGQETPTTLVRAFDDIGTGNLGINLDPANLLMYGKANPVDAVDLLGPFVGDIHAKDGVYPIDGKVLGREKRIGDGLVDFPTLLTKLHRMGYDGPITIEREISGEQQNADIRYAVDFLKGIMAGW